MPPVTSLIGQGVLYAALAAGIGYFSFNPSIRPVPPDTAIIKMSFSHAGAHVSECRRLSPEEIAELPPNMRRPMDCPRQRVNLRVQLEVDGERVYDRQVPPSGLAGDGESNVYETFRVSPGRHDMTIRMSDAGGVDDFEHRQTDRLDIATAEILVIDYDAASNRFVFF